jgi:hypothetical protein
MTLDYYELFQKLFNMNKTGKIVLGVALPLAVFGIYWFAIRNRKPYFLLSNYDFINNKTSIFSVISFILGFYLCVYFLQIDMTYDKKPSSINFIDSSMWIFFIILLINDFFSIFFKISIIDLFDNMFKPPDDTTSIDISGESDISGSTQRDEVFNISNNLYTYEDAPDVCSIYGAKLATYDQVEDAYKNGGEWCNYGWSEGQLALFPTQKSTWSKLQGSEETKNQCGRPGVNGGYMENPYIKFGVNCYGKKPKANDADLYRMNARKNAVYPKSSEDILLDQKTQFWKDNADKLLKINGFNNDKWSEF